MATLTGGSPVSASVVWVARLVHGERGLLFGLAAVIPAVVILLTVITFWISFVDGIPGRDARYTLSNYAEIYTDPLTYRALVNTLWFALVSTVVALLFGVPIAWLVERTTMSHKALLYATMMIGILIPGFFVAIGWELLLHPRIGFLNVWIRQLTGDFRAGLNINTVVGMGFVQGLSLAPLAFIMTAAAFRAMNPALEEAARIHGMGPVAILRRVTLPLIFPSLAAAGIYIFVIGFAAFDIPAIMGMSNKIYTFSTMIYMRILDPDGVPDYGLPAAVGILMFAFAILFTVWYSRFLRSSEKFEIVSGKAYRMRPIELGRWRNRAAWLFSWAFLFLSIGLPLLLLVWASLTPFLQPPSIKGLQFLTFDQFRELDWDLVLRGGRNTLILMVVAPTVTVLLAIPLAWVVVRSGSRWRYGYEFLSFLPHSLPPIVFALAALVASLFVLGDGIALYGTVWIIAVVYVIESIAFVSRVLNGTLLQIHRELEEVGYVSGLGLITVLRRIFVPLVLPAILGVWLWRALVTYRELTVATVLLTPENITLPVVVWSQWVGVGLGQAAAVTLILVAVLTPLILIYWLCVGRRFLDW